MVAISWDGIPTKGTHFYEICLKPIPISAEEKLKPGFLIKRDSHGIYFPWNISQAANYFLERTVQQWPISRATCDENSPTWGAHPSPPTESSTTLLIPRRISPWVNPFYDRNKWSYTITSNKTLLLHFNYNSKCRNLHLCRHVLWKSTKEVESI